MAYHINNTNQPVRFKTWALPSPITDDTIKFLINLGITVRADTRPQTFEAAGRTWRFAGKPNIEVETTSEEQETMLKLKFGTDVRLLMDEYVLPNSMSMCVLDMVKF